jgi:hypothetical protein
MIRGTVCVNCARTGLWGLWAGNYPELPGSVDTNHSSIVHAFEAAGARKKRLSRSGMTACEGGFREHEVETDKELPNYRMLWN